MPLFILKASAGSGKTYSLVRQYLLLLLQKPWQYRHILAITFTNKASKELKERVIRALAELAHQPDSHLGNDIAQTLQLPIKAVQHNAQKALSAILHNYSDFHISTIDSFFQNIFRSFAKELKLPQRYRLEKDLNTVVEQIIARLLLDISERTKPTETSAQQQQTTYWLKQFIINQVEDNKSWKIEYQLAKLAPEIFKEIFYKIADQEQPLTFDELSQTIQQIRQITNDYEKTLAEYGKQGESLITQAGLTIKDLKTGTASFFTYLKNTDLKKAAENKTPRKIYDDNSSDAWAAKASKLKSQIEYLAEQGGLHSLFMEAYDFMLAQAAEYHTGKQILANIYIYGVLNRLQEKLREYRTEQNLMMIADTAPLLREIIKEDSAPFVFEKIGNNFHHIMIDEFQDTSNFQWQNLRPLAENSLGNDHQVWVVGDVKQSIYRWRGGDMNLLLNGLKKDLPTFFTPNTESQLEYNWRSREQIVQFNNHWFALAAETLARGIFSQLPPIPQIANAYSEVTQSIADKNKGGGYIHIEFIATDNQLGTIPELLDDDTANPSDDNTDENPLLASWQKKANHQMLHHIHQAQSDGFRLADIAILVRTNTEGSNIATFLAQNNIAVVSAESLLLHSSLKIRLIISLLTYYNDPRNDIAYTQILYQYAQLLQQYPTISLHEDQQQLLHSLTLHQIFSDHQHRSEPSCLANTLLPPQLVKLIFQQEKKPLYELTARIISFCRLDIEPDIYIQGFLDVVLDFSTNDSTHVGRFLAWWERNKNTEKTAVVVPKGKEAITVMTIHKAKGLEFPIVILPYCDYSFQPNRKLILWASTSQSPYNRLGTVPLNFSSALENTYFVNAYRDEMSQTLLDNLNLMYVAFTRPTERLYVFAPLKKRTAKTPLSAALLLYELLNNPQFVYQPLFDIQTQTYTQGTREPYTPKTASEQPLPLLYTQQHDYWQKIKIRPENAEFKLLWDTTADQHLQIGKKVHWVLELLPHPDQLNKVLAQLQAKGKLQADEVSSIRKRITQIFELPKVQQWFDPKQWDEVIVERPILANDKIYVPDRVLLRQNRATLIDYKTGVPLDKHQFQIRNYAKQLRKMGYLIAEMYLLYIGNAEIPSEAVQIVQVH